MGLRVVSRRDVFSPRAAHSDEASGRIPSQREIRTVTSSSRMVARTPLRRRLSMEKKICTELPEATSYRLHWSTRSTTRSVRCRMSFGDCFGSIASVSPLASSLGQLGRDGADSPPLAAQCGTQKCWSEPYRLTSTRWPRFCCPVTPVALNLRHRRATRAAA